MMQIKDLSYHYKGSPEVLKDVSFDMEPGKFLAILGNNGVGKSTLLKCFNHILKPDAGEVLLDGKPHTGATMLSGYHVLAIIATDSRGITGNGRIVVKGESFVEVIAYAIGMSIAFSEKSFCSDRPFLFGYFKKSYGFIKRI